MNAYLAQELLNELGSSLEELETQHAALLQFLKDEGVVTDEQLASYLTQAGKASGVRWRASRVRLGRLFSAETQKEEQAAEKEQRKAVTAQAPPQDRGKDVKSQSDEGSGEASPGRDAAAAAAESGGAPAVARKDGEQDEGAARDAKKDKPRQEKNGSGVD